MPPLRIIHTPARFHPFIGGVEKYVLGLSGACVDLGNEVTVVCADEPHSESGEVSGIHVTRLPYVTKVANTNITIGLFSALLRADFDIIHTHLPTPWSADISALVSLFRRKPLYVTYHNDIVGQGAAGIIARAYNTVLLPLVLLRTKRIIVTQPKYIDTSSYLKRYRRKIVIIPPGVEDRHKQSTEVVREPNSIFFMSVLDRHHDYKGLDILLRAMQQVKLSHPTAHLRIGGGGDSVEQYRRLAQKLGVGDSTEFLGVLSDQDLRDAYQRCGIFTLPSINKLEGFGIVALEALSSGAPVITTEVAGSAELIRRHNAGLVVAPGDVPALVAAIRSLLDNPGEASLMGKRGSLAVQQQFGWDRVAQQVIQVYRGSEDQGN